MLFVLKIQAQFTFVSWVNFFQACVQSKRVNNESNEQASCELTLWVALDHVGIGHHAMVIDVSSKMKQKQSTVLTDGKAWGSDGWVGAGDDHN